AGGVEFAVAEIRAEMAELAVALADEDLQAAPRRGGIFEVHGSAGQTVAQIVERRTAAVQGLHEGGDGFGGVDGEYCVVVVAGAEQLAIAASKRRIFAQ